MTPKITYGRINNVAAAVGTAALYLSRKTPFSKSSAHDFVGTIHGQVQRQHYILAIAKGEVCGYCGWCMGTRDEGERFAIGDESFVANNTESGNCLILSYFASDYSDNVGGLIAELRKLNSGQRLFGRRFKNNTYRPVRLLL